MNWIEWTNVGAAWVLAGLWAVFAYRERRKVNRMRKAGDAMCGELALCATGQRFNRKRAKALTLGWLAVTNQKAAAYYAVEKVVDPAMGTGGFLARATEDVRCGDVAEVNVDPATGRATVNPANTCPVDPTKEGDPT